MDRGSEVKDESSAIQNFTITVLLLQYFCYFIFTTTQAAVIQMSLRVPESLYNYNSPDLAEKLLLQT
jgi:hypothetical protein